MAQWLYPDALDNAASYRNAERFWLELWQKVLASSTHTHSWQQPWMTNEIPDGNPIFTAVCPPLRRGIRIIHEPSALPGDSDLNSWVDTFGERNDPESILELVVACAPCLENRARIESMLREWIEKGEVRSAPVAAVQS